MTTTSAAAAAAAIQEADPDYWETLDLVVVTEKQIRANKKKNDLLDNLQKSQLLHILNGDYYWGDAKTLEDCSNDRIVDDASMIYKELLVVNNNSKLTTTVESAEETASPRRFYYWQAYFGGNPTGYLLTSSKATTTTTTTTTITSDDDADDNDDEIANTAAADTTSWDVLVENCDGDFIWRADERPLRFLNQVKKAAMGRHYDDEVDCITE
eukprot:CAMPEP_0119029792 /NCGR_PEP_ID=MMETSP1176-20130426/40703_1 /TAXON_ID=265551 /ORGANISM="Synedropsis recta cf, Strain CCMP1620" /LENGTH=211 /DNA_ID=CAMNT_0006986147 /DNA_START=35 /DNA_END=670 /DNA_ORIENTATION=+